MKKLLFAVFCGLYLNGSMLWAQTSAPATSTSTAAPATSALNAELFYRLLIGEITAREGDAGAGYALILDSARKTNDAQLYQRAIDIAFQSRSGDAALQAAQAWRLAQPNNPDANRYVLQILIALNRIQDTVEPLKKGIELAAVADRSRTISTIPNAFARVSDKKLAASVVQNALDTYVINHTAKPTTAKPTVKPVTNKPTTKATTKPTLKPTRKPTRKPTEYPTATPSFYTDDNSSPAAHSDDTFTDDNV